MVRDDGKQWLYELTQSITAQLKENRDDITSIWDTINKNKEAHVHCREQILEKIADLDKRLEITIVKVGALISAIVIASEYLINHFLGK